MFPVSLLRIDLLRGGDASQLKAVEQKGRDENTKTAAVVAQEVDRVIGKDVPFPVEHEPIDKTIETVSKQSTSIRTTEEQLLGEELLGNDSLGG
jgi:hypothetical protein